MIDSDNVLLLRPASPESGLAPNATTANGVYTATSCRIATPDFAAHFAESVLPELAEAPIAWCETLVAENTFPALPVREGERIFIWLSRFADEESARKQAWRERVDFRGLLDGEPETLVLRPTAGSGLR